MKKIYLSMIALAIGTTSMAQETIADHTAASFPTFSVTTFNYTGGDGFISGTNNTGDTLILQKFDLTHGVDQTQGTIDGLKIFVSRKNDSGNGTMVTLAVWDDNSGTPGTLLGSQTVAISAIDTAQANLTTIMNGAVLEGAFNVEVTFSAVNIPTSGTFWAGVDITNTGSGDTVALLTTTPTAFGGTADFADAATHAGTAWSGGFYSYTQVNAGLTMANAIYPVVTYTGVSVEEVSTSYEVSAYPNPANNMFTVVLPDNRTRTIDIIGLTGQTIKTVLVNNLNVNINVSDLEDGIYMYQLKDNNGKILTTKKLVVRK